MTMLKQINCFLKFKLPQFNTLAFSIL